MNFTATELTALAINPRCGTDVQNKARQVLLHRLGQELPEPQPKALNQPCGRSEGKGEDDD